MTDRALDLLAAMEAALAAVPLQGGWHSTPMPDGSYPYGTFYVTRSQRQAGNAWRHAGIVNVWCRQEADEPGNRAVREVYRLSALALAALDGGFPAAPGLKIHDFRADEPRRDLQADGTTWRGSFTFTALTTGDGSDA